MPPAVRPLGQTLLCLLCLAQPVLLAETDAAPTLQQSLEQARAELAQTPPEVPGEREGESLLDLRQMRVMALERRSLAQMTLEDAQKAKRALEEDADVWRRAPRVPHEAEQREWELALQTCRLERSRTELRIQFTRDNAGKARSRLKEQEQALRQAREDAERHGIETTEQRRDLELHELRAQVTKTQIASLEDQLAAMEAMLSVQQGREALLQDKLRQPSARRHLDAAAWESRIQDLQASLRQTQEQQDARTQQLEAARRTASLDSPEINQLRGLLSELSVQQHLELLRIEYAERRQADLQSTTAPERRENRRWIQEQQALLGRIRQDVEAGYGFTKSLQIQLENQAQPNAQTQGLQEILSQRVAALERSFILVWELSNSLQDWTDEMTEARQWTTWKERAVATYEISADWLHRIWRYELFSAEDTLIVDGRKIVERRPVTVGKILQALLILILGLFAANHLSRGLRRRLEKQKRLHIQSAQLIEKVLYSFLVVLVVVVTLITVRIPITVFAFMGGALALGIGFGAQNLINNLISSFILLVERPIRRGDLVEIDGVRGSVEHIGSRCTRIVRIDGVDLLIPNSQFLENSVVNLTHSDGYLRQQIQIGVAYGSDTRIVADLLQSILDAHGKVLKARPAQVYFEDFGDSALLFSCVFWVELGADKDPRRVSSDLRHMMSKRLEEAGIGIPFPQRDVHLDTARPLQVQIQRSAAADAPVDTAKASRPQKYEV